MISQPTRACRWCLDLLGVEYSFQEVNSRKGEHRVGLRREGEREAEQRSLWCDPTATTVLSRPPPSPNARTQGEAYRKLNPNSKYPVLSDGDFVLYESHAIMKYLVESYKATADSTLYPSELRSRAVLDQIMDWHHTNLRPGATFLARRRAFQGIGMDTSKVGWGEGG